MVNGTANGKKAWRRTVSGALLVGALLVLAACGGRGNATSGGDSGSGGDAPAAEATRAGLPTMPSARFAAPTSMITPQGSADDDAEDEVADEAEAEGTPTVAASEEMTATEVMTDTEAMTETAEMTATEEITATDAMTE